MDSGGKSQQSAESMQMRSAALLLAVRSAAGRCIFATSICLRHDAELCWMVTQHGCT